MTNAGNNPGSLDEATGRRLGRLRSMPVDVSRLEKAVKQQVAPLASTAGGRGVWRLRSLRIAAAILVMGTLAGGLLIWAGRPAIASAAELAEIHKEMVSGSCDPMRVDSIVAARKALAEHWSGAPQLPELAQCQTLSCCTHRIGWHKLACVCLKCGESEITMAVGDASKIMLPKSQTISRDGVSYCVQSSGGVNMVSTHRGGRWICLMGKVPVDQLVGLAADMRL